MFVEKYLSGNPTWGTALLGQLNAEDNSTQGQHYMPNMSVCLLASRGHLGHWGQHLKICQVPSSHWLCCRSAAFCLPWLETLHRHSISVSPGFLPYWSCKLAIWTGSNGVVLLMWFPAPPSGPTVSSILILVLAGRSRGKAQADRSYFCLSYYYLIYPKYHHPVFRRHN